MSALIVYVIYLLIGMLAGFLGGLLGVGGGLVVVPAMVFLFHYMDFPTTYLMQVALGTSLAAMVFTAASSALAHTKQRGVNWQLVKLLTPGIILGAVLGSMIADYLPSKELAMVFGASMILIGAYFLISSRRSEVEEVRRSVNKWQFVLMGAFIGTTSAILGIGGGILTVPILMFYNTPLRNAISTSAVSGLLIALISASSFLLLGWNKETFSDSLGYVYLPAFIMISIGSCSMAPVGAKYAYIWPTDVLKHVFGVVLMSVGLWMLA